MVFIPLSSFDPTYIPQGVHKVVKILVISNDHTSFSGSEVFRRLEAETSRMPDASKFFSLILTSVGMSGALNDREIMLSGDSHNALHITGLPCEVNRDDDAGSLCDRGFYFRRIQIVSIRMNVDEDRHTVRFDDNRGSGNKSIWRHNNLIARF